MVLAAFNPFYTAAAAAAVVYQRAEHTHSTMQSYYQQHDAYGNRSNHMYAHTFGNSPLPRTSNQFYSSINAAEARSQSNANLYSYGQQSMPDPAFPPSPNAVAQFKCEQALQRRTAVSDGGRVRSETTLDSGRGTVSTGQKVPSPFSRQLPPSSYASCRGYSGEPKLDPEGRISSPPNYFYATGNAQSYYAVSPPNTVCPFPNANATPPAFTFGCPNHLVENGQSQHEYPWMKAKFQAQMPPNGIPVPNFHSDINWCSNPCSARTRTREKYRMVYTDSQRLELEKEFITNEYISTQRKTYLSRALGLSERQIKIWFQNRRAKKRKQSRRTTTGPATSNTVSNQSQQSRPIVSSTSDFQAVPSLINPSVNDDVDAELNQQTLDNITNIPDPFL